MKHKKETLNLSDMKVGELQPSWRDEVVVEPTEGWVSVSSPVREKESEEVKTNLNCIIFHLHLVFFGR